jgi:tetratricopeptide (TPR) repeat protein
VAAQPAESGLPEDLERMVREGMTEALEARLAGGHTPEEKHLLAQAQANKARRTRQSDERQRAFELAGQRYLKWIEELEKAAQSGQAVARVRLAAARVEYAGMMLSGQAAGDLDEYEITAGRRGDRDRLLKLLTAASQQYETAGAEVTPLLESLSAHEEELLAAGVYDVLLQAKLDLTLNLGWASYYLAVLETKDEVRRRELLATAERKFQDLIDGGQVGQMRYQCYLGLAMSQREQGRLSDAERSFGYALGQDVQPAIAAQIRYELARSQIKSGKFDEARATLGPLLEKDPENLSPEDRPARFYVNLAHLWEANSYLVEAEAIREQARDSPARTAILQKAQRCRETGLARLKRLTQRGGPWPGLVQLYVAASVSTRTPAKELSPIELLYTAGVLIDARRYVDARERLQEAASRPDVDKDVAADVLFELGRCEYLLKNERSAAETFARLAQEYRGHEKAAQAATLAYGLWGQIAERSKAREDYLQLAATLRNLLESFADHPKREEAMWLLPVALQLAGQYGEAADEFGKLPQAFPHWEEAQYRRALCSRSAVEVGRASLSPQEYQTKARKAAEGLARYADQARERVETAANRAEREAPASASSGEILKWSVEARIAAAELLASQGVDDYAAALAAVESFETQYPGSEQMGRVLAVRIRAYRGLRQFEQASRILHQFLQAAPPEEVGTTLAGLAKGMQDEVEHLLADGQAESARELAKDSLPTFEELEKWVRADASRAKSLEFVLFGRARMHYLAGQHQEAQQVLAPLLESSPKNGNYRHLEAQVLTARLAEQSPPEELRKAQESWALLLADPAIRQRAPERYWEARYNWLSLALRLGQAADVETAITQERVWRPDLGGEPWKEKLEALLGNALTRQGKSPQTQPETRQSEPRP